MVLSSKDKTNPLILLLNSHKQKPLTPDRSHHMQFWVWMQLEQASLLLHPDEPQARSHTIAATANHTAMQVILGHMVTSGTCMIKRKRS